MNRKKLLLYILLSLLVLVAVRAFLSDPQQPQPVPGRSPKPAASRPGMPAPPAGSDQGGVRLDLLNAEREPFPGTEKDLFGSIFKVTPVPSMPALPPPPPIPPLPPPPMAPSAETPPSPSWGAQQDLSRFTYLGYLEKRGNKSIFLSAGEDIFVVKKGDRFGHNRQFRVAQLTPDRLVIQQENDPRPITIPLVEQAPLSPAAPGRPGFSGPSRSAPIFPPANRAGEQQYQEETVLPEEAPVEEPVAEPEPGGTAGSPFLDPGRMGTPGLLQPLRPGTGVPNVGVPNAPPPVPGTDQPSPSGGALPAEEVSR